MPTTRLAPTPSGYLHLGNVLSFAVTAAIAQTEGAKILLRIDDLDRGRASENYLQDIFDTLNFLELPYGNGPHSLSEFEREWSQVTRLPIYNEVIDQLIKRQLVFACTCSRAETAQLTVDSAYPGTCLHKNLPLDMPGAALRLITSDDEPLSMRQWQGITLTESLPKNMHNFIIRKKDGFPSYQLTSLTDDMHFGVNLIVRGTDLWPSTLAQLYLAKALDYTGFNETQFYHHLLLKDMDGKKLSKSAGATSVNYLGRQNKTKGHVFTCIAKMLGSDEKLNDWIGLAELVLKVKVK